MSGVGTTSTGGDCPAGCGRDVAPGKLLCLPCWREVPRELQRDVVTAWRKYSKYLGTLKQSDDRRHARMEYQAARDTAIASIR